MICQGPKLDLERGEASNIILEAGVKDIIPEILLSHLLAGITLTSPGSEQVPLQSIVSLKRGGEITLRTD